MRRNSKTPLVYPIEGNVYRAIIPFVDGSSLNFLFKYEGMGIIEPCTLADKFIYKSLSKNIKHEIFSAYASL